MGSLPWWTKLRLQQLCRWIQWRRLSIHYKLGTLDYVNKVILEYAILVFYLNPDMCLAILDYPILAMRAVFLDYLNTGMRLAHQDTFLPAMDLRSHGLCRRWEWILDILNLSSFLRVLRREVKNLSQRMHPRLKDNMELNQMLVPGHHLRCQMHGQTTGLCKVLEDASNQQLSFKRDYRRSLLQQVPKRWTQLSRPLDKLFQHKPMQSSQEIWSLCFDSLWQLLEENGSHKCLAGLEHQISWGRGWRHWDYGKGRPHSLEPSGASGSTQRSQTTRKRSRTLSLWRSSSPKRATPPSWRVSWQNMDRSWRPSDHQVWTLSCI